MLRAKLARGGLKRKQPLLPKVRSGGLLTAMLCAAARTRAHRRTQLPRTHCSPAARRAFMKLLAFNPRPPHPRRPSHFQETKYFDSADWALAKQRGEQPTVSAEESLPPAPITSHRPVMRTSKLDD